MISFGAQDAVIDPIILMASYQQEDGSPHADTQDPECMGAHSGVFGEKETKQTQQKRYGTEEAPHH